MSGRGIHYLADPSKGEGVFRASTIEVRVIDTNSPFYALLGDYHSVGQPIRILDFLMKPVEGSLSTSSLITSWHKEKKHRIFCLTSLWPSWALRWCYAMFGLTLTMSR